MHRLVLVVLLCCGCTQVRMLPYLDQVMTLQDLANEKSGQESLVAQIDGNFDRMVKVIDEGKFGRYRNQRGIEKDFGPPIYLEPEVKDGKVVHMALYRYAQSSKSNRRVHIFYDERGRVVTWEQEQ